MKQNFILILLFGYFVSCQNKVTEKPILEGSVEMNEIFISIPDTVFASYPKHQIYGNYFIGSNPFTEPHALTIFDIENEKFYKKIKIDPNFFKSSIYSFYVHNLDSIFFNSHQNNLIYLINDKGQKINEWAINMDVEELSHDPAGFMFPSYVMYDRLIYSPERKALFANLVSQRYHERSGDENPAKIVEIDLGTGDIRNVVNASVGKMKSRGKGFYPDDISVPQFNVVSNTIFISYPIDPVIYEYDLESKHFKENKKFIEEDLGFYPPMEYEVKKDRKKSWEYRSITPFFENLNYHEELGLFSRIFHHENEVNAEGEKMGHLRNSTIYIYDKNFKLITLKNIENGQIGIFRTTSFSNGWLVAPNEYYKNNESEFHHSHLYKYLSI